MTLPFPSNVSLPDSSREPLVALLNAQLANAVDLRSQVEQAHWNVRGRLFMPAHELFDTLAEQLSAQADDLAERIAALGGYAQGTARMVATTSALDEHDLSARTAQQHIISLVQRFAKQTATLRVCLAACAKIGDPVIEDIITEQLRASEKGMWLLESQLHD